MKSKEIRDLTLTELKSEFASLGEKPYRAAQVYAWLYQKSDTMPRDLDSMTDISIELRERLKERFTCHTPEVAEKVVAADGTIKFTTLLTDNARIESVLIREDKRTTLCVSTQTGCALGCTFCMTGMSGAGRDLRLSEMVGQVLAAPALLDGERITNIVLMGMGEPLLNYDEVIKFVHILIDPRGLAYAPRRVTLSTAGVVPAIERLGSDANISLAVSLNATTDEVRDRLMPINKKWPLVKLIAALKNYPMASKRYITIEYVLIQGVNDTIADAKRLSKMISGFRAKVNLIPFNPHPGSDFEPPGDDVIAEFKDILYAKGYVAVVRSGKGADVGAACGQLSAKETH